MKVVWRLEQATVREVYETLRERRHGAYRTVMTMMNTLEGKGYLKKTLEGRAFRYRPARPERRVMSALIDRGVVTAATTRSDLRIAFPAALAARWMPGLFPEKRA